MEDKKSVFITGAASGIGRASANLFNKEGYYVFGIDINENGLKTLKNEIGASFDYYVADVTNEKQVKESLDVFAKKTDGKMNCLVSNAGVLVQKEFELGELEAYKRMIEVNDYGMVNVIYQSLPLLKATNKASIVLTSSSSAEFGMPLFAVYSSTKGFLRNLTEALSTEFKQYDIKVNDVMPLFVLTAMAEDHTEERFREQSTIMPEDVAKVIFKASYGNKRHYRVGAKIKFLHVANKVLPTAAIQPLIADSLRVKETQKKRAAK